MNKELDQRDDELIDLGSVTDETHGGPLGAFPDSPDPRAPLGIIVD